MALMSLDENVRSLRRLNPSPFLFYLDFDRFAVVGSSPEILVRLRDDAVVVDGKVVTSRWPDPRHRGVNLGFPQMS